MIRRRLFSLAMLAIAAVLTLAAPTNALAQPAYKVHGLDFSPYIDGQDPNTGLTISATQIQNRLQIVAPYAVWVRSFSSTHGLEAFPAIARSMGLRVAAGAWIGTNLAANAAEIAALTTNAQAGNVDIAIVGSEALLRNDVSEAQLIAYINQVRQAVPAGVLVATADTYDTLLLHPSVIAAGNVVLPNIYPYWQGVSLSNAICMLDTAYNLVVAAAAGKPVVISEVGHPSGGNAVGASLPSPANAATFFNQFVSWARMRAVPYFYFQALDESWKAAYEGPQGAFWGVWDKNGALKPGMQPVFDDQTVPVSCGAVPGGTGTPELRFTYVPPWGSTAHIEGQALHIVASDYKIVLYVYVGSSWWVKPFAAAPLTAIQQDGTWEANIVTGGNDALATKIAAFLIPNTYNPPALVNAGSLAPELYQNSVANVLVSRSQSSISGTLVDGLGQPLAMATVTMSGSTAETTVTNRLGKYSFFNIGGAGPVSVTPSAPDYVFTPPSQTFSTVTGSITATFSGTLMVNRPLTRFGGPGGQLSIFFRHLTAGDVAVWQMSGAKIERGSVVSTGLSSAWQIVGSPDLNGDGRPDLLFRNGATGDVSAWIMNGDMISQGAVIYPHLPLAWQITGVGDFDGDGREDLLFRNTATGDMSAWLMNGITIRQSAVISTGVPLAWQVAGTGDVTGDGKTDVVFRNTVTGDVAVWTMNGFTVTQGSVLFSGLPLAWQITGIGDLDGDRVSDLVFRNTATGDVSAWLMRGGVVRGASVIYQALSLSWQIAGLGDVDGDGRSDIVFRNATTGDVSTWIMDGSMVQRGGVIYTGLPTVWQIN